MSEDEEEIEDNEMVLQVTGEGTYPFVVEGLLCGNTFKAIIDTGSPVSMFPIDDLQRIVGKKRVVLREIIDVNERHVHFDKKPLPLLGFMFVSLQVNRIRVSKARVLVARRGTKQIVDRDRLTALRYKTFHSTEEGESSMNCVTEEKVKPEVVLSAEVKQLKAEFPDQVTQLKSSLFLYSYKNRWTENSTIY